MRFFAAACMVFLCVSPLVEATEAGPRIEAVPLKNSPAIHWKNKQHEALENLRFEADVSIHLENCSDVTITCCDLHSVELAECERITFRNCWLHDSPHCGVQTWHVKGLMVQGCRLENLASGVYAIESQQMQVTGCFERNVTGPMPRGQMVQFDKVSGAGNVIRGNYAINDKGKSHPEDVVSIFMSAGAAESPLLIEDNYFTGDPQEGSEGKSATGSGIMLGDFGGSHLCCRRNVILNAGQAGIGVAGGSFITVEDNFIYGTRSKVANVGLYAWNQSKEPSHDVAVARNRVQWVDPKGEPSSWWDGGGVKNLKVEANQFDAADLAQAIPQPPSKAPMPPGLYTTQDAKGQPLAKIPWQP